MAQWLRHNNEKDTAVTRVFIGLGSNLGDRVAFLQNAVAGLPDVVRVSSVYETSPVGGPEGQDPYLNCVVELQTELSPEALLARGQELEHEAGRERRVQWEARTLDVDVLLYGDEHIVSEQLTVPHPRMWERKFVTAPLQELAPELVTDEQVASGVGDIIRVVADIVAP